MDEVARNLFIGTAEDAGTESMLCAKLVTFVISLTHGGPDGTIPQDVSHISIPMMDGPQNDRKKFRTAVREVRGLLNDGETVLVHCSAGASRSPAVAATALALVRDVSLPAAFQQVSERRAAVNPHDAIVQQAVAVYRQEAEGVTRQPF